jgi:hypothetical protein
VSGASGCFGCGYGVSQDGASAFADVVAIPCRNFGYYVAFDYRLTAQSRIHLEVRGLFHAVEFVIFHFGEVLLALFDYYVAGGAGAVSSACMLEVKAEIHGYIEKGFG